jgi:hypothetical protein
MGMTGILRGTWTLEEFHPTGDIPTGAKLTSYSGEASVLGQADLDRYLELIEDGKLSLTTGPVFNFEELGDAHQFMDDKQAGEKIVVRGP